MIEVLGLGEEDENVKRRALLATACMALFDQPLLGEPLELTEPATQLALPARLVAADLAVLRALTGQFRALGRAGHAGMPDVLGPVTTWAERKLGVSAVDTPTTAREYQSALAELHTLAGWCCYDARQIDRSRWHYLRAMRLADDAGDVIEMASGLLHAAIGEIGLGAPDCALKYCQMAQVKLGEAPDSIAGKAEYQTRLHVRAARAYADLDRPDRVQDELQRAKNLPEIIDPFERADLDHVRAAIHLILGNVNTAESYATTAIRTWGGHDLRDCVQTRILLARIHLRAGEPGVERIAAPAINAVAQLRSARARTLLVPLEQALRARGDSTSVDLAEQARQVRHS